jgi:predicted O-linked N-acetylglucosamine transferase (SPINDLY family)
MGVPVIALAGDRHAGRVGVSLLHGLGLDDLIATSPDDYRRLAKNLASDHERLAAYRSTLRTRMRNAPLTDAAGFARDIEAAFRTMWRKWCKRASTGG